MGAMKDIYMDAEQELLEQQAGTEEEGYALTEEQVLSYAQKVVMPRYVTAAAVRKEKPGFQRASLAALLTDSELLDTIAVARGHKELSQALEDKLFKFFFDSGEMPYGTAKARDGDPTKWILNQLAILFPEEK